MARRLQEDNNSYLKDWLKKNPDKRKQYKKSWNQKNPERVKEIQRKSDFKKRLAMYGITEDQFNQMWTEQDGCCKICNKHQTELNKPLNIDHNHTTGQVRGLLCGTCNSGLGALGDTIEGLEKAIEYLKQSDVIAENSF